MFVNSWRRRIELSLSVSASEDVAAQMSLRGPARRPRRPLLHIPPRTVCTCRARPCFRFLRWVNYDFVTIFGQLVITRRSALDGAFVVVVVPQLAIVLHALHQYHIYKCSNVVIVGTLNDRV